MRKHLPLILIIILALLLPGNVLADGPNLLANPGFEEGFRKTEDMGTSGSSKVANGWYPWSLLGDESYNREPEYKVLRKSEISDGFYRIYAGEQSQQYYTSYATHTSGIYQRVAVTKGQLVTFTIWVQIYTGQQDLSIEKHPLSDLHQPKTEATRAAGLGAGDYKAYVGIDPNGGVPAAFGSEPPKSVVWSNALLDTETRKKDSGGHDTDAWTQMSVSVVAQTDYVTVYTKGAPVYRTKHNDTFWDEASLTEEQAPAATPKATNTPRPTATRTPSPSRTSTVTRTATVTRTPTITRTPTDTPTPTATFAPTDTPTAKPAPATATWTPVPTIALQQPAAAAPPVAANPEQETASEAAPEPQEDGGLMVSQREARTNTAFFYVALLALGAVLVAWIVTGNRRGR